MHVSFVTLIRKECGVAIANEENYTTFLAVIGAVDVSRY
jgi:hypothetical protein